MEYDFNEYSYDMVSVQAHVLNINLLCKEVTGGLFYIYLLYTYYMYKCINLFSSEVGAKKGVFNIYPSIAKYTTILKTIIFIFMHYY